MKSRSIQFKYGTNNFAFRQERKAICGESSLKFNELLLLPIAVETERFGTSEQNSNAFAFYFQRLVIFERLFCVASSYYEVDVYLDIVIH